MPPIGDPLREIPASINCQVTEISGSSAKREIIGLPDMFLGQTIFFAEIVDYLGTDHNKSGNLCGRLRGFAQNDLLIPFVRIDQDGVSARITLGGVRDINLPEETADFRIVQSGSDPRKIYLIRNFPDKRSSVEPAHSAPASPEPKQPRTQQSSAEVAQPNVGVFNKIGEGLRSLFGGQQNQVLPRPQVQREPRSKEPERTERPQDIRFFRATDKGLNPMRPENEDRVYQSNEIKIPGVGSINVGVVFDGMGGHAGGEIASAMGVMVFEQRIDALNKLNETEREELMRDPETFMRDFLTLWSKDANSRINLDARIRNNGMGTTIVALAVFRPERPGQLPSYAIVHAGDSRAMLFDPEKGITGLTNDHSWVAEQQEAGNLTPEEAANHPYRNIITQALGRDESVRLDVKTGKLQPGQKILLSSDGLHGVVPVNEIESILRKVPTETVPQELIKQANLRGGPDNITALIAG